MSWNRRLWGVEFSGDRKLTRPHLIGTTWAGRGGNYPEEPTRALLFNTRAQARAWCQAENAWCAARSDCCVVWRFRPVRVVEIVKKA